MITRVSEEPTQLNEYVFTSGFLINKYGWIKNIPMELPSMVIPPTVTTLSEQIGSFFIMFVFNYV